MNVHNHGPAEGRGLDCPEHMVDGQLRGVCMRAADPDAPPEPVWHMTRDDLASAGAFALQDLSTFLVSPPLLSLPRADVAELEDLASAPHQLWHIPEQATFSVGDLTFEYDPDREVVITVPGLVRMYDHEGHVIGLSVGLAEKYVDEDGEDCYRQSWIPVPRLWWHEGGDQA